MLPGRYQQLSPNVGRLIAPNAGLMTGPGTNTYFVGDAAGCAVIDPGPADAGHVEQILATAPGPIQSILVTHTHRDHSPGAKLLRSACGAPVLGMAAPVSPENESGFRADRVLSDGEHVEIGGQRLRAVHTPGHASNHLCYLLEAEGLLFTGDHLMNGSTVVIAPPDGNMRQYLDSLRLLRTLNLQCVAPGHGDLVPQPDALVDWTLQHRFQRERRVRDALREATRCELDALVQSVYRDVDERLHGIARLSLWAHLDKLVEDGLAARDGVFWVSIDEETT